MTEQEIQTLMEVQYLKGRIHELEKAIPTVTNLQRQRKLDVRYTKYINKLKSVSEFAYHLHIAEVKNKLKLKEKIQNDNRN